MLKEQIFLYSPFKNTQKLQLGVNDTWYDANYQKHDRIYKINFFFNYKMSYPNIEKKIFNSFKIKNIMSN